jgi:lipoyl(octanoyl) transferase
LPGPPDLSAMRVRTLRGAAYTETLAQMRLFTEQRTPLTQDELWQVEHPPVFTLGQAGLESHILDAGSIPVVRTERGGQVTYHGPGQVVVYTLLDIRRRGIFVREVICRLEQALIETLRSFGLASATRKKNAPGVYLPLGSDLVKIAALGLKVSRGATYHGVALNVATDLSAFERINPCGYPGMTTVDMAKMGVQASWQAVADELCLQITQQMALDMKPRQP